MFDEKDTTRHIHRGARKDPDRTVEVDSSAFFAPETAQPVTPPPSKKPPRQMPSEGGGGKREAGKAVAFPASLLFSIAKPPALQWGVVLGFWENRGCRAYSLRHSPTSSLVQARGSP